jgi:hypothetical protein
MQDLIDMLKTAAQETGRTLASDLDAVSDYARLRAQHLAAIVGQVGYQTALQAEALNVLLKAGVGAVRAADAADQRLLGIVLGALGVSARVLSGGTI